MLVRDAFKTATRSLTHGKLRSISDVLPEVRNRLATMGASAERTRLIVQLFGRGGMSMLRWLDAAPAKMKAVNKELQSLGMVWGGKQLKTYEDLADAQREGCCRRSRKNPCRSGRSACAGATNQG